MYLGRKRWRCYFSWGTLQLFLALLKLKIQEGIVVTVSEGQCKLALERECLQQAKQEFALLAASHAPKKMLKLESKRGKGIPGVLCRDDNDQGARYCYALAGTESHRSGAAGHDQRGVLPDQHPSLQAIVVLVLDVKAEKKSQQSFSHSGTYLPATRSVSYKSRIPLASSGGR